MPPRSAAPKRLTLNLLQRARNLWREDVHQITFANLQALAGNARTSPQHRLEVASWTHRMVKVRVAHRLRDFLFLPYEAMMNQSVRRVYDKYVRAFCMHEDLCDLKSPEAASEYWLALAETFVDHQKVTQELGTARRQLVHNSPGLAPTLDAFLNRFFVSRIGTHLIGANFLNTGPTPEGATQPANATGCVLEPMKVTEFVRDISRLLLRLNVGRCPPIEVEESSADISIVYIPVHLRAILTQILRNAIAATLKEASSQGCDPWPIRVEVNKGQIGVFVTVADRGGGIVEPDHIWDWGHIATPKGKLDGGEEWTWSSFSEYDPTELVPSHGMGLPIARLTARYFGGDVKLQTVIGYGTNVYIHIPELTREGMLGTDDSGGYFL